MLTSIVFISPYLLFAQVGLSVFPLRVHYTLNPGETGSQKVLISNVSKEHPLNLSLTFGDWKYDTYGNNQMFPPDSLDNSCARWLSLPGGTYLTLEPDKNWEIDLTMIVSFVLVVTQTYRQSCNIKKEALLLLSNHASERNEAELGKTFSFFYRCMCKFFISCHAFYIGCC